MTQSWLEFAPRETFLAVEIFQDVFCEWIFTSGEAKARGKGNCEERSRMTFNQTDRSNLRISGDQSRQAKSYTSRGGLELLLRATQGKTSLRDKN